MAPPIRTADTRAADQPSPRLGREEFGLGNPRRVQIILDHGGHQYREDNGGRRRPIAKVSVKRLIEKIQDELDEPKNNRDFFDNSNKSFIPHGTFARILTPERVFQLVRELPCYRGMTDPHKLAQDIYFGSSDHAPFLKVLGMLIGAGRTNELPDYMKDGLSDDCLPLRFIHNRNSQCQDKKLRCRHDGHSHDIFAKYEHRRDRIDIHEWNLRLNAPYFKHQANLHSHYVIEKGFPLPVCQCEKRPNASGSRRPTTKSGEWAYGGFSEVSKVQICDSHCNFGQQTLRNPNGFYALKRLTSHSRANFELELSSLLFAADQGGSKKHLIQLLATFEERNPSDGSSTFYFLFDWAHGDLVEFWRRNKRFIRDRNHCLWMAEQFHGLAEALQVVHNDRLENLKHLTEAVSDQDLYGRHGDIKAGNLLWFDSNGQGILTLADFGLGRLHTKVSRSKQDPNLLQRTATYRAPEFDMPNGLVSPVSDIFSLGCVFLEYISWFLLGLDAVMDEFPNSRTEQDIYSFQADTFFSVGENTTTPRLKSAVKEWIQRLRRDPDCTCYLQQMLDLIELEMLEPLREKRIRALPLAKRLKMLVVSCQRTPSFYLESTNPSAWSAPTTN